MPDETQDERVIFSETVEVGPTGTFYADLDIGEVHVESHDRDEITVEARARTEEGMKLSLEQEGEAVYFEAEIEDWPGITRKLNIRIKSNDPATWSFNSRHKVVAQVRVPRGWTVDVVTQAGSIEVRDVGGDARAEAKAGSIDLRRVAGSVVAHTVGGPVRVEDAGADVDARTVGGPILLKRAAGDVELRTVGGPIRASGVRGRIEARAGAGPITARFGDHPAGALQTGAGAIDAQLPEGAGVDLEAQTSMGRVSVDRELDLDGRRGGTRVVGRLAGGGESLLLRTGIGAIRVRGRHDEEEEPRTH